MMQYAYDRGEQLVELGPDPIESESFAFDPESFDDDDELELDASESYDDDDETFDDESELDDDDEEILGLLAGPAASLIGAGVNAIGRLVSGPKRRKVRVRPVPNRGRVIRGRNTGTIMTRRGPMSVRFRNRYVTPAELRVALGKVQKDIQGVRSSVTLLDSRTNAKVKKVSMDAARALSQETRRRTKDVKKLRGEIGQAKQEAMMMSLLTGDGFGDDNMLPLLLMSGGSLFGGSGGGSDNSMMNFLIMQKLMES